VRQTKASEACKHAVPTSSGILGHLEFRHQRSDCCWVISTKSTTIGNIDYDNNTSGGSNTKPQDCLTWPTEWQWSLLALVWHLGMLTPALKFASNLSLSLCIYRCQGLTLLPATSGLASLQVSASEHCLIFSCVIHCYLLQCCHCATTWHNTIHGSD